MFENELGKNLDRRSFLRGSALFAGAIGLSVVPALAQQPQQPEKKEEPKDPFDEDKKDGEKKLIDKEGREYRICPQCGYNMYKQGRMWVCDNCGYSYVE
jgi:ribosomal protein S27AE